MTSNQITLLDTIKYLRQENDSRQRDIESLAKTTVLQSAGLEKLARAVCMAFGRNPDEEVDTNRTRLFEVVMQKSIAPVAKANP
jgi:hypothetical protein